MMHIKNIGLMAAVGMMLAVGSHAAQADDHLISVEINKGEMIRLDRAATSIVVADPNTADVQVVSPKLLVVHGKKVGETSLYAIDAQDNPILDVTVDVTADISEIERAVKQSVPDADVSFKSVDGGLVMNGYAGTVAESEKIRNIANAVIGDNQKMVNMIQTAGSDQVMLKVKFVEMARTDLKKLGVNLQNVTNHGNFSVQLIQGNYMKFFPPAGSSSTTDLLMAPQSVLDRGTSSDTNFMLRYKDLSGLIDALETQGLATVLAEPNLTTTSGQPASFLAGGKFPVPAVQPSGSGNTITIQYQDFGVALKFTPVVMSHDRISLTVNPSVSTLDFSNPIQVSGVTYPILDTRQASSVVELGSGDSFMLAGLLENDVSNTITKFPALGDLPVLGALFRSTQFQNNQTELVILVTPYIVHPVAEASKLQTPLDGYKPPSDLQLLMQGNLYQQQPMSAEEKNLQPLPKLHGDGGFIME